MKDFNFKKFIIAFVAVYVVSALLSQLVHNVILGSTYESMTIWRADMMDKMWIGWIISAVFWLVFVLLYHFVYKGKYDCKCSNLGKGACYGFLIGLINVGQLWNYVLFPLSFSLCFQWFVYGLISTIICGIVLGLIYKPKEVKE